MLRLNIGSGMLRLSSCMLRLGLTSSVQGAPPPATVSGPSPRPPWTDELRLSMHGLSLRMHEPDLGYIS